MRKCGCMGCNVDLPRLNPIEKSIQISVGVWSNEAKDNCAELIQLHGLCKMSLKAGCKNQIPITFGDKARKGYRREFVSIGAFANFLN